MEYQLKKLDAIQEGMKLKFGGNLEFELYYFFEICYHLKDWIKEDHSYSNLTCVESFINSSPALRIAYDIGNRLKHKVLRKKRTGEMVENSRSHAALGPFKILNSISIGPEEGMAMARILKANIQTERGEENCFSLAKECAQEWNRYFLENGIK